MQPEFDPYCVGVVYMGPSTKKKITKPPEPLPFTRTATRACSIIYSPRVDLSMEFDLYSDNDGSAATMVMVRLVLCTVRFFYTLWVPLVRRTGMHIHHLNSVRVRLWLVGVDMMGWQQRALSNLCLLPYGIQRKPTSPKATCIPDSSTGISGAGKC